MSDDYSHYIPVCTIRANEADRIIKSMAEAGVRLVFEPDNSRIKYQSISQARHGGTFGIGATVALHVHPDDLETYESTYSNLFDDYYRLKEENEPLPKASSPNKPLWIIGSILAVSIAFYTGQHWSLHDESVTPDTPSVHSPSSRKPNAELTAELNESDEFIERVLYQDDPKDEFEKEPLVLPQQEEQ